MNNKLYLQEKKTGFVYGKERKDLKVKVNNNSADFITPNFSHGCELACSYCYVARHNKFGNPLTVYGNTDDIIQKVLDHHDTLPGKFPNYSNQQDDYQWVYDIGECTDMLTINNIEATNFIIKQLILRSDLKPTFATKAANRHSVKRLEDISLVRARRARIRVSLMPQRIADVVEVGTARIMDRIEAIRAIYEKGYEVHINFSPVIIYKGWTDDYIQLMLDINEGIGDDGIGKMIKSQLASEIIFLTHHPKLHESNLVWNKEAEEIMWNPSMQEYKVNKRGATDILRYQMEIKKVAVKLFIGLINKYIPYCRVRYAF